MWKTIKLKFSMLVDLLKTIYNDIFRMESDLYKPYTTKNPNGLTIEGEG